MDPHLGLQERTYKKKKKMNKNKNKSKMYKNKNKNKIGEAVQDRNQRIIPFSSCRKDDFAPGKI
jgi:hypothetical protein